MHLGSKHDSEASFSFQINDAVKGDEEYLLAEDDFLRDANDYTITTPAPSSRPALLEHGQQLTAGQMASRTGDHNADTSLPPKLFTPSSPARANVYRHEAAATKGLNTPKASIPISKKPSTAKPKPGTFSTSKWPPPSQEIHLPHPEASPAISRLANLGEEIAMLAEDDGLYPATVEEQQDEHSSNKRTSFQNRTPLNSNMPTPVKLENPSQIRVGALMNNDDQPTIFHSVTQPAPTHEPRILSPASPGDDNKGNTRVMTTISREATPEQEVALSQKVIDTNNPGGPLTKEFSVVGQISPPGAVALVGGNGHVDDSMAPLTISQLSPHKCEADRHPQDYVSDSSTAVLMSPMRPPRKRPVSVVTSNYKDERSKKGKTAPRTTRSQVTTRENSGARKPSRLTRSRNTTAEVDTRNKGSAGKRLAGSGSGSRSRASRLSSSGAAVVSSNPTVSSRTQSQSQRTNERVGKRNDGPNRKRAAGALDDTGNARLKADGDDSPLTDQSDASPPVTSTVSKCKPIFYLPQGIPPHEASITPTSHPASSCLNDSNNDGAESTSQNHGANLSNFKFKFRSEIRTRRQRAENSDMSNNQHPQPAAGSTMPLTTSNTASMASSNSRSIASRTRSQFKYIHHRPIPDYKAQHALLESSLAQRKENIAPLVPLSFEFHTDTRAKERERFDATVKEKEQEMEQEREAKRKEREEQEQRELKVLRRKAVPKANVVPEWYKDAPRKRRVAQAQGSGTSEEKR